jgi:DNA-binding transcriptional MerR regulator
MAKVYKTDLVMKLTGATSNQLKYWARIGITEPEVSGRRAFYSFKDIIKLRVLVSLRKKGLSLQKVRLGISRLSRVLPKNDPISRVLIYTDGLDMIVVEKGKYFSAITEQQYFQFDTEQIRAEIKKLQKNIRPLPPQEDIPFGREKPFYEDITGGR